MKQAPCDIDEKIIMEVYQKNNNNVLKTLMELWNIVDKSHEKNKWDEIRETCDDFDTEMQKMMKRNK